ncbi:MAG: hydroxymethylbilane synthase [Gemmataceae bacterium]
MTSTIRIGTRGSKLALWQANYVQELLKKAAPEYTIELIEVETSGDVIQDVPLVQIGGQGAFTKEIQKALQDNRIDVAVHSLKDLPTFHVENLVLAAVPPRGPIGDAFVSTKHSRFSDLPKSAVVATSSLRRRAQIALRRPDLQLVDIRGNVDTRLRKLVEQDLDGIILAEAGLRRLGLDPQITEVLDPSWMYPAVGQGALGLEARADDEPILSILDKLNDAGTLQCVLAERAMLRGLGGGCEVPIGARTSVHDAELTLSGIVVNPEGTIKVEGTSTGPREQPEELGQHLANQLLDQGAKELLDT